MCGHRDPWRIPLLWRHRSELQFGAECVAMCIAVSCNKRVHAECAGTKTHGEYFYFCDTAVNYCMMQCALQCAVRCHVINERVRNVRAPRPMANASTFVTSTSGRATAVHSTSTPVPCCSVLQSVSQCVAERSIALQWMLQCVAECCSVFSTSTPTLCCSVLQSVCRSMLQCTAVCCSECFAVCCSVLQCATAVNSISTHV